jgi:AraC-like DNA-binding protein
LLNGCSVRYTDKNKNSIVAGSGDVIYIPIGSEYEVELMDFESADSHTVGINFYLFDENGEKVTLSDKIMVFKSVEEGVSQRFYQSLASPEQLPYFLRRLVLFELVCLLFSSTDQRTEREMGMISEGVNRLREHPEKMIPISELARACNISEVYFRKQFKAVIGMSPVEYRNTLRLDKARQYLEYGDISVQEISDTLGYSTVSHFIKCFRERFGVPPLEYRTGKRRY